MKHPARWIALARRASVVVVFGVVLALNVGSDPQQDVEAEPAASGKAAPAFNLPTLDGRAASSCADLAGKTVVVNFWNSWCIPCRAGAARAQGVLRRAHATSPTSRWSASCATTRPSDGPGATSTHERHRLDDRARSRRSSAALDFGTTRPARDVRDLARRRGRRRAQLGPMSARPSSRRCSHAARRATALMTGRLVGRGSRSASWSSWPWPCVAVAERRRSRRAARAHDLATELACPECEGLSVADSNAPTSRAIRADIKRRIAAGQSDAEIRQAYVDELRRVDPARRRRTPGSAHRVGACPSSCWCSARAGIVFALRRQLATQPRPARDRRPTSALVDARARCRASDEPERARRPTRRASSRPSATSCCGRSTTSSRARERRHRRRDVPRAARRLHRARRGRRSARCATASTSRARRRRVAGADASAGHDRLAASSCSRSSPASSLAYALGARLPGQTSRATRRRRRRRRTPRRRVAGDDHDLQAKVNASPDDYDAAPRARRAPTRQNGDLRNALTQSDAAITIDPNRPEPHANAGAAALPRVASRSPTRTRSAARRRRRWPASTTAITVGSRLPRRLLLPRRSCTRSRCATTRRAQADLQKYLVQGAERPVGRQRARRCSRRSRRRSRRRRLPCHPPDHDETRRSSSMAQPARARSTTTRSTAPPSPPTAARSSMDLDPQLAPNTVNNFVGARARRATTTASRSTASCPTS